jgi:hypothetical protein
MEFIRQVGRKMRYRRKTATEVQAELTAHFEDELYGCRDAQERQQRAQRLIEQFGDAKLLAVLCRRAKKRCRPMWRKVLVRSVQAAGVLVLYSLLCSLRLLVGTPSLRVDYLAWLSARTRGDREESLNAKPYFDKAAGLLRDKELALRIPAVWPDEMNEPERQILADVVAHNAEAFETLRQGVTKPCYWVQYETAVNEPLPVGITWPAQSVDEPGGVPDPAWAFNRAVVASLPGYKELSRSFRASVLWNAYQGDVSGALDDCLVLMDFGMHLEGRGVETEQLVGAAIEALGRHLTLLLLDRCAVPASDLARIQSRLGDLYVQHGSVIDVTGDRAVWLALVQRTFTDDGTGNGRTLKAGLPLVARDWKDGLASLLLFHYPDRREMTSLIETLYGEYQLTLTTEPSRPQYEEHRAQWMTLAQESFLLGKTAPALDRMTRLVWRVKTGRWALMTILGVMRYAKERSVYPPTLDTLVAEGYMNELPIDPYSGRAFGYQRTEDGFLLYSVGEDFKDDGGRLGIGPSRKPQMWADNGDWVFWPVSP